MMGTKIRDFSPLPDLSLKELVPTGNLYRRLEERLDLSFVRELVEGLYAPSGRPSVDPAVFFKPELILFFEDLRSERQLMEVVVDRLSLRWYSTGLCNTVGFESCTNQRCGSGKTGSSERVVLGR